MIKTIFEELFEPLAHEEVLDRNREAFEVQKKRILAASKKYLAGDTSRDVLSDIDNSIWRLFMDEFLTAEQEHEFTALERVWNEDTSRPATSAKSEKSINADRVFYTALSKMMIRIYDN